VQAAEDELRAVHARDVVEEVCAPGRGLGGRGVRGAGHGA
jgi:hypothetical protein